MDVWVWKDKPFFKEIVLIALDVDVAAKIYTESCQQRHAVGEAKSGVKSTAMVLTGNLDPAELVRPCPCLRCHWSHCLLLE